jgi:hypothetical protein
VDRERIVQLVGGKVAVRLSSAEALGVELLATLDEVRDDGVVISEIGELGPGPTMFVPWDSLQVVEDRALRPQLPGETTSDEEEDETELYSERREPSARTMERVVPIAQRQTVRENTVSLSSLELHGDGLGVLRYLISQDEGDWWGIPEPEFILRDGSGRLLPWLPQGAGASDGESDGDVRVEELPDAGELEVEVLRLVFREWSSEREEEEETESCDGPWIFRFSI